jgi:hypothetical protein
MNRFSFEETARCREALDFISFNPSIHQRQQARRMAGCEKFMKTQSSRLSDVTSVATCCPFR